MSAGAKKILGKMADLIERAGLAKGTYRRNGAYCIYGALDQVCSVPGQFTNVDKHEAVNRIALAVPNYGGIVEWNDAPERTKEEVVALLRRVERRMKA